MKNRERSKRRNKARGKATRKRKTEKGKKNIRMDD